VGLRGLDDLAQPKLEMVRGQCHTLEMALEEVTIIVGQLPGGAAGVEVVAQRRNDERLNLGGGSAADQGLGQRGALAPLGIGYPVLPTVALMQKHEDGEIVFRHTCKLGLEGIVSKRKDSTFRSGRSPDRLKMKNSDC
jgi:hypothetical protein